MIPTAITECPPSTPHAGHEMPDAAPGSRATPGGDAHDGHGQPAPDAHTGHAVEADPHAGHAVGEAVDPHAGHDAADAGGQDGHAAHAGGDAAHAHHNMVLDADGMVMNHNPDQLPRDCAQISEEVEIVVRAGREFARPEPGWLYGYDAPQWIVPPCAKVNVTFENRDAVRHQWMVHGLPRYLYPMGMFTLEVYGPGTRRASFIVPSADQTYLAHCDVPHHMEKGMKGQLVVGSGGDTLPSIPGLSAPVVGDTYAVVWGRGAWVLLAVAAALGVALGVALRRP